MHGANPWWTKDYLTKWILEHEEDLLPLHHIHSSCHRGGFAYQPVQNDKDENQTDFRTTLRDYTVEKIQLMVNIAKEHGMMIILAQRLGSRKHYQMAFRLFNGLILESGTVQNADLSDIAQFGIAPMRDDLPNLMNGTKQRIKHK